MYLLNISVFNALSIVSGLVAAVLLIMKREVQKIECNFLSGSANCWTVLIGIRVLMLVSRQYTQYISFQRSFDW